MLKYVVELGKCISLRTITTQLSERLSASWAEANHIMMIFHPERKALSCEGRLALDSCIGWSYFSAGKRLSFYTVPSLPLSRTSFISTTRYKCVLCRGRELPPPHLARAIEAGTSTTTVATVAAVVPRPMPRPTPQSLGLAGEYYVDDVCLSQRGAHHMKQLEAEMGITHTRRKRRFKNENTEKDAGDYASVLFVWALHALLLYLFFVFYVHIMLIMKPLSSMPASIIALYLNWGISHLFSIYISSMPYDCCMYKYNII